MLSIETPVREQHRATNVAAASSIVTVVPWKGAERSWRRREN